MNERTGTLVQNKFSEYLFPTIMTSLAMSVAEVVDGAIVGNLLGDDALAAIGLSLPIVFCINTIYMLFAIGGMSAAAIAKGEMNQKKANQVFTVTMFGGIAAMTIFLIAMLILMEPITLALAAGDVALANTTAEYLRPLLFAGPTLMFSAGLALFMRQDGKPQISGIVVVIANIINLIFDYTLIRYLDSGIMGAGLSTALGYAFGGVVVIPYLLSKNRTFHVDFPKLGDLRILVDIIKTGLPKALIQVASFLRSLVLNSIIIVAIGSIGMSVMTVYVNLLMIANIFVGGTSDALLPIAGSLYGEKDYYGIRKSVFSAIRVLVIAVIGLVVFLLATPETVGKCFGLNSPEALEVLSPAVRMLALYLPFQAFNTTLQNFYNVTDRKSIALAIPLLDGFVFVSIAAVILTNINNDIIWMCYSISGLTTSILIILVGSRIKKKEKVTGLLLIKEEKFSGIASEFSIEADKEEAAKLSEGVIDFCLANDMMPVNANRIGLAIEEMVVNVSDFAKNEKKKPLIDVFLKITGDEVVLKFRDNGKTFDLSAAKADEKEGVAASEVEVLKRMATKIEYIGQLGFNVTIFRLKLLTN